MQAQCEFKTSSLLKSTHQFKNRVKLRLGLGPETTFRREFDQIWRPGFLSTNRRQN